MCIRDRIRERPVSLHRRIGANVFVQPRLDRGRRATDSTTPATNVDARARNGSRPVAMRAPLPFERVVAERVAAGVQVDVPDGSRDMARVAAHLPRHGQRLPLEAGTFVRGVLDGSRAERRQDLSERAQGTVRSDAREQMHVIGHQRAGNDVEMIDETQPEICAGRARGQRSRAIRGTSNQVQQSKTGFVGGDHGRVRLPRMMASCPSTPTPASMRNAYSLRPIPAQRSSRFNNPLWHRAIPDAERNRASWTEAPRQSRERHADLGRAALQPREMLAAEQRAQRFAIDRVVRKDALTAPKQVHRIRVARVASQRPANTTCSNTRRSLEAPVRSAALH